jgi:tripartite-type tricarboxylate transporter receptor subunit TctC
MKNSLRYLFAATLIFLASRVDIPTAQAQAPDSANRTVSWVVGFAPGGISDQGTRFVAKVFAEKLGQPVVVDNKAGAGGIIAAEHVMQAKPDGNTLLYASSGPFGSFKTLYKKLPFDPLTSFTYIHGFGSSPLVLVVPTNSPHKSLKDLVEFAKANPDKLNFGSVGAGTAAHLVTELLAASTGTKLTHVPYKGSAPAMIDLLGGRLDFVFDYSIVVKPQIEAGKLRALASTGALRLPSHPDVATTIELGYPDVQFTAWAMIVGPAGMPQPLVDRMAKAFNESLKDPAVVKYHDDQGVTLMPDLSGSKLREFVVMEQAKMKELVERSGATAQ